MEVGKVGEGGGEAAAVGGKAMAAAFKLGPTEKVRGAAWGRRGGNGGVAAGSGH
jgi:hypothetical protein